MSATTACYSTPLESAALPVAAVRSCQTHPQCGWCYHPARPPAYLQRLQRGAQRPQRLDADGLRLLQAHQVQCLWLQVLHCARHQTPEQRLWRSCAGWTRPTPLSRQQCRCRVLFASWLWGVVKNARMRHNSAVPLSVSRQREAGARWTLKLTSCAVKSYFVMLHESQSVEAKAAVLQAALQASQPAWQHL